MFVMLIRPCALALGALLLVAADTPIRKELDETRRQLFATELELEKAKIRLPFGPDGSLAEERVRSAAKEAGVEITSLKVEPPTIAFAGGASWELVHKFLHRLAFSGGLHLDVRIHAAPQGTVTFDAVITYPVVTPRDATAAPRGAPTTPVGAMQRMLDAERAMLQHDRDALNLVNKALSDVSALETLNALAAFSHALDDRAVALIDTNVSDRIELAGIALGGQAVDGIRPALQKAGFDVIGQNLVAGGECTRFSVTARLARTEHPLDVVIGNGLFDVDAIPACTSGVVAASDIAARGTDAKGITMRLRNVDVSGVFLALHDVTGANFAIDGAIGRRFNVTVQNATLGGVLDQARAAGLKISAGHIHRVSSKENAFREQEWAGEPVTLSLRDADLVDILCLFHQISQLDILVPRDLRAKVAMFATDVPWDEALGNLVASAGLQYAIDKNRVFIGTKAGDPAAVDTCVPATRGAGDRQWSRPLARLENIAARDLVFAGVAGANDKRKAYAYGPTRKLWPLEPGTRLYDARVESVGADGATLKTDDGQIVELRF